MKRYLMALAALTLTGCCGWFAAGDGFSSALSPDGRNEIRLWAKPLAYEVLRDGVCVVARTEIGMKVNGAPLAASCRRMKVSTEQRQGTLATPIYKKAAITLAANETLVSFGDWAVRLVARDDGVAYRFETAIADERVIVDCERAEVTIPAADAEALVYYTKETGLEEVPPKAQPAGAIATNGGKEKFIYLPLVYSLAGKTVAVTDVDVRDYPGWYLQRGETNEHDQVRCTGHFARMPRETAMDGRWLRVKATQDYLVETAGSRTFPWRAFILADEPSELCEADLVYALAAPQAEGDFSWVKPGKVAWDWWNDFDHDGVVSGCTTATYRRFIDFASRHGLEYVIFDEGWSRKLDIWAFSPDVDVPGLIRYGEERGVGIILWMAWSQIYGQEEKVAEHFSKLGAKGFKVDFMDRADADVAGFLEKFAAAAARHRMVLDYHGMTRPTGLSRTYPNVLNYEGIHGLEQMKFFAGQDMAANDVGAFFGRLTVGPMDYTPGAMDNYPVGTYPSQRKDVPQQEQDIWIRPGSEGTRVHQLAMMSAYEAPLQMLCDSPTKYEANPECLQYLASVPVVWDDTVGLGGDPRSYAAVARRRGGVWYVSALNNRTVREWTLKTDFLDQGEWKAEIFRDNWDADREPTHYIHETRSVTAGASLTFRMAAGGGVVVRFTR